MPRSFVAALLFSFALGPSLAHAGGTDYVARGTRALGRGGAFMARADDPTALGYNPAALAFLPGYQLQLGSHLAFYDACVQRSGGYDDSGVSTSFFFESRFGFPDPSNPGNYASQGFPLVCRDGAPGPSPQLVFTGHPLPELGFAIGILSPSAVGSGTWGNPDGSVDVNGMNLPNPLRYAQVHQELLLFHPSVGIGWSPVEWISVGLTLQWGIAIVDNLNHTSSGGGPEDPADDVRTQLSATDFFVPAMIASVHVVPIDELDIAFSARITDSIDADATLNLTTGTFGTSMNGSLEPTANTVSGATLHAGLPWELGLSVRYADRRRARPRDPERVGRTTGRVEDRMVNESFDLELDVVYLINSQVTDFVVRNPAGAAVTICSVEDDDPATPCNPLDAPLPGTLPIVKGWQDQISIRAGGDWNVLPGTLAIRGGLHFETNGLSASFATQDFMPGMRFGMHLGLTVRFERFDISAAYAHIFQLDHVVSTMNAGYRLVAATSTTAHCTDPPDPDYDPSRPVSSRGCYPSGAGAVVNGGTYFADYNVLSLSARYHFD